jgi:5,10-methylenetetrahydrofolate reductase
MARYISRNMPHIFIPDDIIERIQRSPDKVRECSRIAAETVVNLKKAGLKGVYLSTIGWEHKLPDIIEGL